MDICLIGLNHGYQLEGCRTHDWASFEHYLEAFCKAAQIDLIAEELSEWAIQRQSNLGAVGSVAKNVSFRLGIKHLFCDPDEIQRKQLGMLTDKELRQSLGFGSIMTGAQVAILEQKEREQWGIRERFWLEQLQKAQCNQCVFILGAKHVDSFGELLAREDFVVKVEHRDWGA